MGPSGQETSPDLRSIICPIPEGSGASLVHRHLARHVPEYQIRSYDPRLEYFPFVLPLIAPIKDAALIHTTPDHAIFFRRKSVPLVITFHNYVLDRGMRPYSSPSQRIHYATDLRLTTRLAVEKARTITAVSRFTARLVQRDMGLPKPVHVIYNGIDTHRFVPGPRKIETGNRLRVLFSGNLTLRKGVQWLHGIAEKAHGGATVFYTLGPRKHSPLAVSERLQSVGSVPHKAMPGLYRTMDMLLMPTVREGFGLSIAEAMACGLPIVASNCSAIPELVDHGKGGFLCPVGDVNDFARKINHLADSPGLRKAMGEYNRAKVEKMFTVERMLQEYKNLFEEMLG